jgi:hypothetical protein
MRWEANNVYSEQLWARRQRRQAWSATRVVARARGEDTPSEPESLGGDDEEEDEDEEEGEVTPLPHSSLPEDLPSLGASSASKWGSPSACASQNSLRQRLGHRPAHHRSPALHWYLLTYRG